MTELSDFAKALATKKRKSHEFDVGHFYGMSGDPIAKVAIRVATKREQDIAVTEAHKYAQSLAGKELQEAAKDRDILEEAKTACILSMVVRDASRPDQMPCFPSGPWMMEHHSVDQLAVLLNLYEEVKNRESSRRQDLDEARLDALASALALTADTDIPEAQLADVGRPYLTHALVLFAVKIKRLESQTAELERLASQG